MSEGDLTVNVDMDYIGNFAQLKESINGIAAISKNIDEEAELVEKVSANMKNMENFTTNTQATSEECVALSEELYAQVDLMNQKINEFKL